MIPQPPPGQGPIDPQGAFPPSSNAPGMPTGAAPPQQSGPPRMPDFPTLLPGGVGMAGQAAPLPSANPTYPRPPQMPHHPLPGGMPPMPPFPYPPPPRRRGAGKAIFISLLVIMLLLSGILNLVLLVSNFAGGTTGITQQTVQAGSGKDKVAVIPLHGIIEGNTSAQFNRFLTTAEADTSVKALVLEID